MVVTAPNLATELHSCTMSLFPSVCMLETRTAPKVSPVHITATVGPGRTRWPTAITPAFFMAARYECLPSDQTALVQDGSPLESAQLVLIPTGVTKDIDTPGINKLLHSALNRNYRPNTFLSLMGNAG